MCLNTIIIGLTGHQERLTFVALTAVRKLVAMKWKQSDKVSVKNWIFKFLDVIYLESSTASVIGVKESSMALWVFTADSLKEQIGAEFKIVHLFTHSRFPIKYLLYSELCRE